MIAISFGDDLFPEKQKQTNTVCVLCVHAGFRVSYQFSFLSFVCLPFFCCLRRTEVFWRLRALAYSSIQKHQAAESTKQTVTKTIKFKSMPFVVWRYSLRRYADVPFIVAHTQTQAQYRKNSRPNRIDCCRLLHRISCKYAWSIVALYYANAMWCRFKFNSFYFFFLAILHIIISSLVPQQKISNYFSKTERKWIACETATFRIETTATIHTHWSSIQT